MSKSLNNEILVLLKCPVCFSYMRPPVVSCFRGKNEKPISSCIFFCFRPQCVLFLQPKRKTVSAVQMRPARVPPKWYPRCHHEVVGLSVPLRKNWMRGIQEIWRHQWPRCSMQVNTTKRTKTEGTTAIIVAVTDFIPVFWRERRSNRASGRVLGSSWQTTYSWTTKPICRFRRAIGTTGNATTHCTKSR